MKDEKGPKAFTYVLEEIADGDAHREASDALQRLGQAMAAAAAATGKAKGELTLTLKLSADKAGAVEVTYDVAIKEPKPARPKGVAWLDKAGNLVAENPRQPGLPLRSVDAAPPREVPAPDKRAPREV